MPLHPSFSGVFQKALEGGVSNLSFGDLSASLGRTMYQVCDGLLKDLLVILQEATCLASHMLRHPLSQFKFRIPPYYTLLARSLTVLEGIALASDPSYKVWEE